MYATVCRGGVLAARPEEQVAGIYQIAVGVEEKGKPRAGTVVFQVAIDNYLAKLEGILALAIGAVLL